MRRILFPGLSAALLGLAFVPAAFAQMGPGSGGSGPGGLRSGAAEPTPAFGASRPPPPTALPGLQGRPSASEPIPAGPNVANLSPNAALFDAINRGDLPAARDAVGRGADLESRNVLGLTPLDAAIDQGRNEIYFFLVSARGGTRSAPGDANLTPQQRAARERQARGEAERVAREQVRQAAAAAGAGRGAAPQPANPRLFANDGGAPVADYGFLGFDAGRGGAARAARGR